MKINIITLFPEFFESSLKASLLGKAIEKGVLEINFINLREFGEGKHKIVDDTPYSGGPGLILKADIADKALSTVKGYKIIMSASGKLADQKKIDQFSKLKELTILCPRYEGFDERIINFVDEEISTANFVMSGGEIPALSIIDAIARLLPGFMNKIESTESESFRVKHGGHVLVEYPHYTRPETYKGSKIPEVIKSGNHNNIEKWRYEQALGKTKKNRPDLLRDIIKP